MAGVAIDIVGKFSIFFCFNKILTMVNFGFSGQFESKSQRYSDSRRIGANAACGLFVNFWGFNVSLSLSKGLSNVIRLRYFGKLNMTDYDIKGKGRRKDGANRRILCIKSRLENA